MRNLNDPLIFQLDIYNFVNDSCISLCKIKRGTCPRNE